jgi:hypothetical protein
MTTTSPLAAAFARVAMDGDADALGLGDAEAEADVLALGDSVMPSPADAAASAAGVACVFVPQAAHTQAVIPASRTVAAAGARRRFVRVVTRQP